MVLDCSTSQTYIASVNVMMVSWVSSLVWAVLRIKECLEIFSSFYFLPYSAPSEVLQLRIFSASFTAQIITNTLYDAVTVLGPDLDSCHLKLGSQLYYLVNLIQTQSASLADGVWKK